MATLAPSAPETPAPLLPAALGSAAAVLWLWAVPLVLLLLLNFQGYQLVHENMNASQLADAWHLGLAGLLNLGLALALAGLTARWRSAPRTPLAVHAGWFVPLLAIGAQVGYLWLVCSVGDDLIPRSVAVWIFPPGRFFFTQFSFAMLPLAHGVLRLAALRPAVPPQRALAFGIGSAVGAPLVIYLLVVLPRHWRIFSAVGTVFAVVLFSLLGIVLFAGLTRALLVGLRQLRTVSVHAELIAIVCVAFCCPIGGLLLNREIDFPVDFQAWEVYALVAANTLALLFASRLHDSRPLLSLGLLCATLPFSLYFFIVFLPYTPLALLAILACGFGFLILSPTLLFVLQLHLLNQAVRQPRLAGRRTRTVITGVLCFLLLPAFFTGRALADRAALHAALDYVYSPSLNAPALAYPGSPANLRRALASHRSYKNGIYYPLLSDFYACVVFDHLVLPDDKIARLEQTFFGDTGSALNQDPVRSRRGGFFSDRSVRDRTHLPRAWPVSHAAAVTDLTLRTAPTGDRATTATVSLTLANAGLTPTEYLTTLPVPPGVFVTGFRLSVNGTLVSGRIFEKKTALWVYTMIRDSERRDPGLLFYRAPGELELHVYPVVSGLPSRVEIDFLLPVTPASLAGLPATRDPTVLLNQLGRLFPPQLTSTPSGTFATLDSASLPAAEREPYLHLIIDRSLANSYAGDLAATVRALREKFPAARTVRVTLANYNLSDWYDPNLTLGELASLSPRQFDAAFPRAGSLALDAVLAHAIRRHREIDLDRPDSAKPAPRPIFVILSHRAANRPLDQLKLTANWSDLLPGLELHELGDDGLWLDHLVPATPDAPLLRLGSSQRPAAPGQAVRFAATAAAPLEFWSPATASWRAVPGVVTQPAATPWADAVALQLHQQDHARSPGDATLDLPALVRASRDSGLLVADTSYIVVENAAQWRMLEKSERQKLGQNTALEFRETPAPGLLILSPLFLLWLHHRGSSRRRLMAAVP